MKLRHLALAAASTLVFAACGSDDSDSDAASSDTTATSVDDDTTDTTAADSPTRIKYVVNGTLGDKSFIDSANRGLTRAAEELDYELQIIELGYDETKWQPGLEDAAAGDDYDILVAGSFSMSDFVGEVAPKYPDKKFWVYDAPPDFSGETVGCSNKCENVYAVTFKQNEGSYLVGFLAGSLLVDDQLAGAEGLKKVGIIGGADIPVINDFVVGFTNGFVDAGGSEDDVLVQYVGGDKPFGDPAKGKEIAVSMYDEGAAIVWGVAGLSGAGSFEAAVEYDLYTFGVDSDQYQTTTDEAQRATIVTSMVKKVDEALFRAAELEAAGELTYGLAENVGVAEDAVGVAVNENYELLVPEAIATAVDEAAERVKADEVEVATAFD